MSNWTKISSNEMEIGLKIATLKKGELQIKYAKDIVAKDKEIERLNKQIEEYQKALDETVSEKVNLHSIINKIRNYVYKPIDKEWDDILCIIEDGLKDSDKE